MPAKSNFSIYEHYRGNEEFVKHMQDRIDRMQRSFRIVYTPFLTSSQQMICTQLLGKQIVYKMDGGYAEAEYKCLALCPDTVSLNEIQMPFTALHAKYSSKYGTLTHRDVLGALMHLGIRREQFGDILVQEDQIIVFVHREISSFVKINCTKIARRNIRFEEYQGEIHHETQLEYSTLIVSSLRLDVLVSTITKLARSKAQEMIRSKLVKVDHAILEDCSHLCNNNSILSIRGYGRFLLCLENRSTKKGNLVVTVGKYV